MANTAVEFKCPTGMTLTLKLFPYGVDAIANGAGDAATERTNCKGIYTCTVTEALAGLYDALIIDGSGNVIANYSVYLVDDTATYRCGDGVYSQSGTYVVSAGTGTVLSGTDITILRGDTTTISVSGLGNITARTKLWFTAKRDQYDPDSAAMVLATESGGLVTINGRDDAAGETCVITVTDATAGNLTIVLSAAATKALPEFANGYYDIQMLTASGVTTLTQAEFGVSVDITQAIV